MNKLLLSFTALSFLAACEAGTPPAGSATPAGATPAGAPKAPSSTAGHFYLHATGSNTVEVLVDNDNITGAQVSVARYQTPQEHAIRGRVFGKPVDVAITDKKATGIVGTGPLELASERREGKIHISGLVGGTTTDFEFNMKVLKGKIGQCLYDLTWTGKSYDGTRGCARFSEPVSVAMPTALGKWSDPEIGVCLGILMGAPSSDQFSPTAVGPVTNTGLTEKDGSGANPFGPHKSGQQQ